MTPGVLLLYITSIYMYVNVKSGDMFDWSNTLQEQNKKTTKPVQDSVGFNTSIRTPTLISVTVIGVV